MVYLGDASSLDEDQNGVVLALNGLEEGPITFSKVCRRGGGNFGWLRLFFFFFSFFLCIFLLTFSQGFFINKMSCLNEAFFTQESLWLEEWGFLL